MEIFAFALRQIGVSQMNIGIYENHAFLIRNLDKVSKHYACAECQARFTKAWNLRQHAEVLFERGNQGGMPRSARMLMKKRFMRRGLMLERC